MKDNSDFMEEIESVKQALVELGPMHPGSLSQQKRIRGGEYCQLSYSFAGKGHTLYVREGDVDQVREEVANYGKFRSLVNRWIELEIECSRVRRSGKKSSS
jgi:hypothetical protein